MGHARTQERNEFGGIEFFAFPDGDHGADLVLGDLAPHRDRRRLADWRKGEHLGLDLKRRDIFAAPPDGVFEPVDKIKIALGVATKGIAGVEPAVAPGGRRSRWISRIAVAGRHGQSVRITSSPTASTGSSQSFSSTMRTSTPERGRPVLPSAVGFAPVTIGIEISVMLKCV